MTEQTKPAVRMFVGGVWILLGAIAAIAAVVGVGLLISGGIIPGLVAVVIAAVFAVMTWSTGRSFRAL